MKANIKQLVEKNARLGADEDSDEAVEASMMACGAGACPI